MTKREKAVESFFEWPMIWVTLLLVPIVAIPYFLELDQSLALLFTYASIVIWALFYVEVFVKFIVSSNYFATAKRNWLLIVILLSPALLSFRLLRLARLVSLVRVFRLQNILKHVRQSIRSLIYNVEYVLLTLFVFVLISSFFIWQVEQQAGGAITTFSDALWWSVITITTVGYGDVIPTSNEGRLVGALVSLIGIILFMVFIARVTSVFVRDAELEKLRREIVRLKQK